MDAYVFVDESGDLGFGPRSSSFFTLGYAIMLNQSSNVIENRARRLRKNMNRCKKITGMQEFKFSNDSDITRTRFLTKINTFDLKLGAVVVSKDSVQAHLKSDKSLLYNYIAVHEIIDTIVSRYLKPHSPYNSITYVIDKSTSVSELSFNEYCEGKIKTLAFPRHFVSNIRTSILHLDSQSDSRLQVADYVAGAVSAKFTRGNSKYYDIIKNKISHKKAWDWNHKINW